MTTQAAEAPSLTLVDIPNAQPASLPAVQQSNNVAQLPTPSVLLQRAVASGNTDIALMERLWTLHVQHEAHEAKKQFNEAFAKFKSHAITIIKSQLVQFENSRGDVTSYMHETLFDVVDAVTPHLSSYGLSLSWRPETPKAGEVAVTAVLRHAAGHSESVTLSAAPDDSGGKNRIQAIGSTVKYLERYTAEAILGVAAKAGDDDGNSAAPRSTAAPAGQSPDKPKDPVLVQGWEEAEKGMAALTAWWSKLDAKQRKAFNNDFGAMRKTAQGKGNGRG